MPHVEGCINKIRLRAERARQIPSDHECEGPARTSPVGLIWLHTVPGDIGIAALLNILAGEVFTAVKLAVPVAEISHERDKPFQPRRIARGIILRRPVEPVPLLVMAVGVVVALLGAVDFVTHREHRHSLAQEEQRHCVALETRPQGLHGRIIGLPLHSAVPTVVVVGPIAVLLGIGKVVLVVVAVEIAQGKTVVTGQEIHRGGRPAAGRCVEVG